MYMYKYSYAFYILQYIYNESKDMLSVVAALRLSNLQTIFLHHLQVLLPLIIHRLILRENVRSCVQHRLLDDSDLHVKIGMKTKLACVTGSLSGLL